ncbi:MAG: 2-oxo acid dehydrogenase subunit E2 [Solirubrobacterales bacterium]|nr:2-oxo acid dehydrogenase subunit E2 [Solirubrobacterales bacterium]
MTAGNKGEVRLEEPDRGELTTIRRGAESRATVPDLDLTIEVDCSAALSLPQSLTAALVKACALALRATPRANGSYRDGRFELYSRVNIAVSDGGIDPSSAPTILDADTKPLSEIDQEVSRLVARAREGSLSTGERSGATFTLIDIGSLGAVSATPLVIPPQAACIAAGASREVVASRDGLPASVSVALLTLAFDQRILDWPLASSFLAKVKAHLEDPSGGLAL